MIRHIVAYTIKDEIINGKNKQENIAAAKKLADEIGRSAATLHSFTFGSCAPDLRKPDYYDIVLNCLFETREDLETYRKHPAHVAFAQFVHTCMGERASIDYYE